MELRDILNSEQNYTQTIEKKIEFIKRDLLEYKEFENEWQSDRVYSHFARTFMYQYQIMISKYSLGLPILDLVEDYKHSISFMEKGWKAESGYVQMVWMLSIGILLEIEQENFDKLITLVERDGLKDFVVDFLISYRKPSRQKQSNDFQFSKPYKAIQEIISLETNDKQTAVIRLQKYLQKEWYSGHKGSGWHDDHKSKWGVHFGYWSFESGAIVKILGLDDSSLKDQQYYPYDLVHWGK